MAISDRITSMEEHLKESYQELEGIGIDTTGVNNNLENIPKLLDGYWETLPKVTGEGTSITLDNTKEAKMKIELKGNTNQDTITGEAGTEVVDTSINVNDLNTSKESYITLKGNTYQETTTGKNLASNVFSDYSGSTGYKVYPIQLEQGQQYTLSANLIGTKKTSYYNYGIVKDGNTFQDFVSPFFCVDYTTGEARTGTFTIDSTYTNPKLVCYTQTEAIFDELFANYQIQFEKSSSATSYEPYTNGASPNPDYPQDIHTVNGDNEVVVCGKNLFNKNSSSVLGWINNNGNISPSSGIHTFDYIPCKPNTDYVRTTSESYGFYDENKEFISRGYGKALSTPSNAKYIRISVPDTNIDTEQLELGTTATTYEPYNGDTYELDLGKNLIYNKNGTASGTYGGVQYTINDDGSITVSGTAESNYNFYLMSSTNSLKLEPGTYTLSGGINNKAWVRAFDGTTYNDTTSNNVKTFTITETSTFTISLRIQQGTTVDGTFYPMLEKGSTATTYAPYFEPIELCKIGNYQDRIFKSGNKWYLHKEIEKYTFTGSENWSLSSYGINTWSNSSIVDTNYVEENKQIVSNIFTGIPASERTTAGDNVIYTGTNSIIIIRNTTFTTLAEVRTATQGNYIYYVLGTPTNTEITNADLITQLNALYNATTYSTTNINTTTNNLLPYIDFKYNVITPSPSPEIPSDIKVVSGDNTIVSTGKNLFGLKQWLDYFGATYTENSDGSITFQTMQYLYNTTYPIKATDRVEFSYKITNGTGTNFRFTFVYEDGAMSSTTGSSTGTSEISVATSSSVSHGKVIGIRGNWSNAGTFTIREAMIEKFVEGQVPTTYEPYGKEYPVNLGVVNLLPTNSFTLTKGTNRTLQINFPTPIPEGTYTLSCKITNKSGLTSTNGMAWALYDGSVTPAVSSAIFTQIIDTTTSPYSSTKTSTRQSTHLYIYLQNVLDDGATITIEELQLEQRDKASSFSPYGATPIELCKIGTYQDRFIINSGKNLLDRSACEENKILVWATGLTTNNTDSLVSDYIEVSANEKVISTYRSQAMFYDSNKEYLGCLQTGGTTIAKVGGDYFSSFTTPNNTQIKYVRLGFRSSVNNNINMTIQNIMSNKGDTLLPYEPYGNGDWYLEKKTRHLSLAIDDMNNTNIDYAGWLNVPYIKQDYPSQNNQLYNLTEYLLNMQTYSINTIAINTNSSNSTVYFPKSGNGGKSQTDWKNNYSGLVCELYYGLQNAEYTQITGTLASQLEALNGSKSYTPQTNISQNNNDMASVLNATALSGE